MAFTKDDYIMGVPRGTADLCKAHAVKLGATNLEDVKKYVDEIYRLAPIVGIDPFVLYVQAVHETGKWDTMPDNPSPWWRDRLNPAGIGITGDTAQNNASYTWPDGTAAAWSHIAHMLMYTVGRIDRGGLTKKNDPRYDAYIESHGDDPIAEVVADLENTWGWDNNYAEAMEENGRAIWPACPASKKAGTPIPAPTPVEEGNSMPEYTPNIIDRWLHVAQLDYPAVERRYKGRFGMTPKIIVVHIQEGYNLGSWQWFHETTASATVEIAKNGDIWRLVPEGDAPWTNGDVNVPTARGREILNKWGADPNVYTLSIENEGFNWERHTASQWAEYKSSYAKQVQSNLWQIKQWQAKYRIDIMYVIRHKDISTVGKPFCPGDEFYNALIAALKGDTSLPPVVEIPDENGEVSTGYSTPSPVPGFDGTKDVVVRGATFHAEKRTVTVDVDELRVRKFATVLAGSTREPLVYGDQFDVHGWVKGEKVEDEDRWWITAVSHSRVWVGGTAEKPSEVTPPTTPEEPVPDDTIPEQLPDGVKIVNGITFYPAFEPNSFNPRVFTVAVSDATVRDQPSIKGKAIRKVNQGDELTAKFWCFGEDVKGDRIWWLIDNDDDPFTDPQFLWANVSLERPD